MNTNIVLKELLSSVEGLLEYIDAIPSAIADAFPAMPGCNRDELEADLDIVKSHLKKNAAASVTMGTETLIRAVLIKVKHPSAEDFCDWLAGQRAIASTTGFISAVYVKADETLAYYRYSGDPKDILPALPVGQSYVWISE